MAGLRSATCYAGHDLEELEPPVAGMMRCPCCVDRELWAKGTGEFHDWWFPANALQAEEAERLAPGWSWVGTASPGGRPPGWVDPELVRYTERETEGLRRIEGRRAA